MPYKNLSREEFLRRQRLANHRWRAKPENAEKARKAARRWHKTHPEWSENWRKNNLEKINKFRRKYARKIRLKVLKKYGGKCACCGLREEAFLTMDHVYNDGAIHRKKIGRRSIYLWLWENGRPRKRFQILCANCQLGKRRIGGCPHQQKK